MCEAVKPQILGAEILFWWLLPEGDRYLIKSGMWGLGTPKQLHFWLKSSTFNTISLINELKLGKLELYISYIAYILTYILDLSTYSLNRASEMPPT